MELLRARVLDKGAHVRQRALQVWAGLVGVKCVPLSWWNVVVGLGEWGGGSRGGVVRRGLGLVLFSGVLFSGGRGRGVFKSV